MNTILFQIPLAVDTLGIDLATLNEPTEKTLSIIELITSGGLGGQIIMTTLGVLSILTVYLFVERFQMLKKVIKEDPHFMNKVKDYLSDNKVDSVITLCERTASPVANLIAKGTLSKNGTSKDIQDAMERQGNLEVYKLEHNLASLATIAGAAPMIGFLGTVIGMIQAFDKIQAAGDMQPSLVAGGIKVALLTTVFGLVVAIILQIFYNYIVAKIDSIVNDMEDASITLIDILVAHKK